MRLTIFTEKKFDLIWEGDREVIPRCGDLIQIQDGRVFKVVSILHRIYTDAVDVIVES